LISATLRLQVASLKSYARTLINDVNHEIIEENACRDKQLSYSINPFEKIKK
jgi:hypothetical protein